MPRIIASLLISAAFAAALLLSTGAASATMIESTFDVDADGWTANVPFSHVSTGGNPGGYFRVGDGASSGTNGFAPPKFLGDLTSFIGGSVSYDLIGISQPGTTGSPGGNGIIIEGPTDSALHVFGPTPFPTAWTTFVAPMTAAAWGKTGLEWSDLLSDVTTIRIGLDATNSSSDIVGMDNFRVTPEPSGIAMAAFGFVALVAWGWRRRKR